uniref:Uncharacterized protein n=1 Tax=Arundo donax TaxID=35708 RepID=A0A0A9I318_ARUDO
MTTIRAELAYTIHPNYHIAGVKNITCTRHRK